MPSIKLFTFVISNILPTICEYSSFIEGLLNMVKLFIINNATYTLMISVPLFSLDFQNDRILNYLHCPSKRGVDCDVIKMLPQIRKKLSAGGIEVYTSQSIVSTHKLYIY